MHPEFISALARERQAELLRRQKFRHEYQRARAQRTDRLGGPVVRARWQLGLFLVSVGTKLLRRSLVAIDLLDAPRP